MLKVIIVGILATVLLSLTIFSIASMADSSSVEKTESVTSVTVNGKMGVKISDTLCITSSGTTEICLN